MDAFVAATYGRLDRQFQARAIIEQLTGSHPGYPVEQWLANYIKNPEELNSTMALLHDLGLPKD